MPPSLDQFDGLVRPAGNLSGWRLIVSASAPFNRLTPRATLPAKACGEMRLPGARTEASMQERLRYDRASPDVYKAMMALTQAVEKTGLSPQLIDLVNYRVSQLNSCAFCLDMHSKDLRARGETEQRLYMVSAWREAPHLYSDRERAALAWAEAVTRLENQQVPDAVYDTARKEFSEAELAQLTLALVAINGWNRLNVAFNTPAGNYRSAIARKTG
jgi:AhpD family alkylhydroperoxidase